MLDSMHAAQDEPPHDQEPQKSPGTATEVFRVFLKLGLTSFGGPVAHLGYFRDELVLKRRWVDESAYAQLVALSQFLPGPASSQVGFGLGLYRAGWRGAMAAFIAFTLPSAVLMAAIAYGATAFNTAVGASVITGLKIVAVAIVAQAVMGMAKSLAPDKTRALIAVLAAGGALLLGGGLGQILAILAGAVAGYFFCRDGVGSLGGTLVFAHKRSTGILALALFALLLLGLPLAAVATGAPLLGFIDAFYRSGSLVFGGGHVVLPLLHSALVDPGLIGDEAFLTGYGAAQAMPGPLFTFAAYLGVLTSGGVGPVAGAVIALVAIFLPGFLLLIGVLPFYSQLGAKPKAQAMMRGVNAGVLGILTAALYDPVFTSSIHTSLAFVLALLGFVLLTVCKLTPWLVVLISVILAVLLGA